MSKIKTSLTNSGSSVWQGLCCLLMFLCCLSYAYAEDLPKTAKLLPPETVFLIDIDDFQQLKAQFEQTCLYKLYEDPAMSPLVESAKAKLQEKIRKLDDNDIFKTIFSAGVKPQGKVSFAFVFDEQSRDFNEPQIIIITQWGEGIDKIREAVDEMLQKNIEYGGHQKLSEDYRGVSIQITIDEASSVINHCFIDDYFIASTSLDILKFIIAHSQGASSAALGDDTDYTAVMKAVGPYHDIDFYINIKQIINRITADSSAEQEGGLGADMVMAGLGIDNVAAFGGSVSFARTPGVSGSVKAFLKINGAKKGLCKMLEVESAVIKAPRFLTGSTYAMTFFNLNIQKGYEELYNILYTFNPQYTAVMSMLDLPDSQTGEPGMEFKSDVIGHLGSQIIFSRSMNKPFSNTSLPTESLTALAVDNRDAIEKSLSLLHSRLLAPNDPEAKHELLGHTIYLLKPSALPFIANRGAPSQSNTRLAFTVTDTHLIFAGEAAVERAVRTLTNSDALPAGSTKWFNTAKSAIPSAVGTATFQDYAASSELFWWAVKDSGPAQFSTNAGPMELGKYTDVTLLPEYDAVRKYFGISAFYGINKPDGFFFELKYLNPLAVD